MSCLDRADRRYRAWKPKPKPSANAVIVYVMDVSGSMGADQKELVRIESFWLDAWIRSHYQGTRSVFIVHDAAAKEVDRDTFFRIRESGGTVISSAYELCRPSSPNASRRRTGTSTCSTSPTARTTAARTPRSAWTCCRSKLLPSVNLFGYGQVESYGTSGDFYEALAGRFAGRRPGGADPRSRSRRDRRFDQDPAGTGKIDEAQIPLPGAGPRPGKIEGHARNYGLTFFRTVFEMVDYDQMNALAAYGGFPTRYPHYRFGMEYQQMAKSYEYGLHKIYEMVINNDPTYAYLLEGNTMLDQKLVMAHVYGHADFFFNNMYFAHTNRRMIDEMANHATRIRRYQDRYGVERVSSASSTPAWRSRT